jgi:hypothetical protein
MQQLLLGWTVLIFGCGLMVRVLFRHNDSFAQAFGFMSVGVGAALLGLWLVRLLDLPQAVVRVFASI